MVSRIPPPDDGTPRRSDRPGGSRASTLVAVVLLVALAAGAWLVAGRDAGSGPTVVADDTGSSAQGGQSPQAGPESAEPTTSDPQQAVDPESGLPTVSLLDLPPEAAVTVEAIERGPPYPYEKDGSTFGNYEGLLPDRDRGHYQEFTVETPGSSDRGARRIVEGADGALYWTDDHYASFARIVL
jgi:ribonuclease T1